MAKEPRPQIHGGTYHLMNRGNRKCFIFADDQDRKRFDRLLIEASQKHGVEIQAGTQMGTHFHLIVVTPHANVSAFMQQLEGDYAEYFNWRHGLVGHLFQGPFVDVVIESDFQLFTTAWYVFANPCAAGLCTRFEDWPWSTYAATAGLKPTPSYLSISWVETLFPSESLRDSQRLFRTCMEAADPIDAYLLAVDPTCSAAMRSFISERIHAMSNPCSLREILRPPLEQLFPPNHKKSQRDQAILTAKIVHGYSHAEIAKAAALHPSSVSRLFCIAQRNARAQSGKDSNPTEC
jgi:REP element-mobilizing transposase RayT